MSSAGKAGDFSAKAPTYHQYRWAFDEPLVHSLLEQIKLPPDALIADIGAGTGLSSLPFMRAGYEVQAVEPDAAMRQEAARNFADYDNFHVLDGRAECSGLVDDSVDLIVVGRAIHWFQPAATRREFARISKRDSGLLAIMAVSTVETELSALVKSLWTNENGWDEINNKFNCEQKPLHSFFDGGGFQELRRRGIIGETWPQFLGRQLTISTAPNRDHPLYPRFEAELRTVFDQYEQDGTLQIATATEIAFGTPAVR